LQNVLSASSTLRIFIPALFFIVNVVLCGAIWPFKSHYQNYFQLLLGVSGFIQVCSLPSTCLTCSDCAFCFQGVAYLGLLNSSATSDVSKRNYFFWLIGRLSSSSSYLLLFVDCVKLSGFSTQVLESVACFCILPFTTGTNGLELLGLCCCPSTKPTLELEAPKCPNSLPPRSLAL
jgi:hypothetical protein